MLYSLRILRNAATREVCIVSFQFGPRKGWVVKAGNVQGGLPHPQSAKNASPRGWQKLPNGGKRLPHAWF